MKILALCISLLAFTGCDENPLKPDFSVGDCAILEEAERWELNDVKKIVKVIEVGNNMYLIEYVSFNNMKDYQIGKSIRYFDRLYKKTECPNE